MKKKICFLTQAKANDKSLKNEFWIVDDSISVHNIKNLKSTEKKFSKRKLY